MSMPKKKIQKNIIFDLRILIKNFKKPFAMFLVQS